MPTENITWVTGQRELDCRVCGASGPGDLTAEITALQEVGLLAVRCPNCGSLDLAANPRDFSPTPGSIDAYVESGAGIGTMAEVFADVPHSRRMRFLDVGCNYPFALDLARFLYDWDVVGVEPSPAGARGAKELRIDVRSEYLTPESVIGDNFDVILASEVIEHVTHPLEFLTTIRGRLAENGTLVMTTPAAEIVSPDSATNDALLAISPGFHVFLASVRGMELLLQRAGFERFAVIRTGGSLRVTAWTGSFGRSVEHLPVNMDDLDRYYTWRGRRARANSPLGLGLATRSFRLRVARGDFHAAGRARRRLLRCVRAVHRVDLRNPKSQAARDRLAERAPLSVIGSAFSLGMYELLGRKDPERAAGYFEVSELVGDAVRAASDIVDGDASDIRFQAPFHRALALARFDPSAAAALAMRLSDHLDDHRPDPDFFLLSRQCRIYTELVAAGVYRASSGLDELVAEGAAVLSSNPELEIRTAGLDALFSLGIAALNSSDVDGAMTWLAQCLGLAVAAPESSHRSAIIVNAEGHLELARSRQAAGRPSITVHHAENSGAN